MSEKGGLQGLPRLVQALIDGTSAVFWTQIGRMTANDPPRQQEAVNRRYVELPGHSSRSYTQLRHR